MFDYIQVTFELSSTLVSMTIMVTCWSQIICQKSQLVFGVGPGRRLTKINLKSTPPYSEHLLIRPRLIHLTINLLKFPPNQSWQINEYSLYTHCVECVLILQWWLYSTHCGHEMCMKQPYHGIYTPCAAM